MRNVPFRFPSVAQKRRLLKFSIVGPQQPTELSFHCRFTKHIFSHVDNMHSLFPRGFVKYSRSKVKYRPPKQRMKDWNEIYTNKGKSELKVQAARWVVYSLSLSGCLHHSTNRTKPKPKYKQLSGWLAYFSADVRSNFFARILVSLYNWKAKPISST